MDTISNLRGLVNSLSLVRGHTSPKNSSADNVEPVVSTAGADSNNLAIAVDANADVQMEPADFAPYPPTPTNLGPRHFSGEPVQKKKKKRSIVEKAARAASRLVGKIAKGPKKDSEEAWPHYDGQLPNFAPQEELQHRGSPAVASSTSMSSASTWSRNSTASTRCGFSPRTTSSASSVSSSSRGGSRRTSYGCESNKEACIANGFPIVLEPTCRPWESRPWEPNREVFAFFASPHDAVAINVRDEIERVGEAFAGSSVRLRVGVSTTDSLFKVFALARSRRGLVLHLSVHSTRNGRGEAALVLEDDCGLSHSVSRPQLEELLGSRERAPCDVSLLVLSSCESEEIAQVFVDCGCRYVIFLRGNVLDKAARKFSELLFHGLGVGHMLADAYDGARRALRADPDPRVAGQAGKFGMIGDNRADEEDLNSLTGFAPCRLRSPPSAMVGVNTMDETLSFFCRESEDASVRSASSVTGRSLPQRPDEAFGRATTMHEVEDASVSLQAVRNLPPRIEFLGHQDEKYEVMCGFRRRRRVMVIHSGNDPGRGTSAFGVDFAHFASAPGREFSCNAWVVRLESTGWTNVAGALQDALRQFIAQLTLAAAQTPAKPSATEISVSDFVGNSLSGSNACSDFSAARTDLKHLCNKLEVASVSRRGEKLQQSLLVIDDDVGALALSGHVGKLLGDLLENTHRLQLLICSKVPMYGNIGGIKLVNVELQPLNLPDAAAFFMDNVHRTLLISDFSSTIAEEREEITDKRQVIELLFGSPLLQSCRGNPRLIQKVTSLVVPGGPSLIELAKNDIRRLLGELT